MATRSQRYSQLLSSHPYHSAISSAPSFALGASDGGDNGTGAVAVAGSPASVQDDGVGALASPRLTELPRGAVSASDRFFVSPARAASLVDAAGARKGAGDALWGAVLVETYSSDPRGQFLESMAEMAAACDAEGMPAPEYREFMEEMLSCYLERNDRGVHRHVLAAFADLTARRWPTKRRRPLRRLMKINPCVSGT
ncbi:transcription repressor OFP12-like [Phragmites australis]|uniref:transcription repressor OFP12-like n=1 Tax=Phragmites australis TaxID=29695 RepID=UPI002D77BB20|nr:transcription repressor OFP12-like [Phragmites australis]